MRIPFLFVCLLLALPFAVWSQQPQRCGTDQQFADFLQAHPGHRATMEAEEAAYRAFVAQGGRTGGAVRTIPVVVHLIQSSSTPTISDARVISQIEVLNEDFRKLNADTTNIPMVFQSVAADCEIEFCLATIDPQGCPTTGINRVISPTHAIHDQNQSAQMKGLIQWDPYKYLNMWVPEDILGGILGYATFPTQLNSNPNLDGVVMNGEFFGRGNGTPVSSYNLGRTATHEVGHWLGLFHTFQNGCAGTSSTNCNSQGDLVCDTPPTAQSNFGCPGTANTCTETPTDQVDQTMNYMDYVNDACMNMFSQGQKVRMDAFLNSTRLNIWSSTNLTATGCDGTTSPGCTPQADFGSDQRYICVGDSVQFEDLSYGIPTNWQWTFQGGSPGTSSQEDPSVTYSAPGTYLVTLEVTNAFGNSTKSDTAYVVVSAVAPVPLTEGFENGPGLPSDWYATDATGDGTWSLYTGGGSSGSNSVVVENFGTSPTTDGDDLATLPVDLSSLSNPALRFDRAYRRFNSFTYDSLKIQVSTDCGETWTTEWSATGLDLATVGGLLVSSGYVPQASHWRTDSLDLTAYAGQSNVRIRFRSISGGGQNIYLDNINIDKLVSRTDALDLKWSLRANSPFSDRLRIAFELESGGEVRFVLRDLQGAVVKELNLEWQGPGQHLFEWNSEGLAALPAGIFLLEGHSTDGKAVTKVLKLQ